MDHLFANIARYTDLLPVLLFIFIAFNSRDKLNKGLWVIFFYCVLVALNDNILFKYIPESRFDIVFSSFTLVEFFTFCFYLRSNTDNRTLRLVVGWLFIAFTLFIISYFILVPFDINIIDSVPIGVETILVIALSVYFLYDYVNRWMEPVYNTPMFWVITGFLIYLAGSFFIYVYANHVPYKELTKIWFVTFIFTTIKNILLTVAFWVAYKRQNKNTSDPREYQPFLN